MPHSATSATTHNAPINGASPPLPEPAPAPAKVAVAAALDRHSSMHARTLQQAAEDCNRRVSALLALDPDTAAAKATTTTTTPPHLLLLLLAALARRRQGTSAAAPYPATLQAVYILARHPFAEVDAFVEASFDLTDGDWPRFMRVHPVVDWHYTEIWGFIRAMEVEYCSLYDQGYTSLGGTNDTLPNPALKKEGAGGEIVHRPAYELVEDDEERLGRDR
ncbi:hypothetical protein BN1723_017567 [Verticillium longisporum]|uniref:FAD synthase n=1 Tax=Verticillium longisporum TaxID=100787 RepID=A0A0G4L6P5_VERLO|nr:hypothetical protein BN1723_017567 [Verticillium longisporum]